MRLIPLIYHFARTISCRFGIFLIVFIGMRLYHFILVTHSERLYTNYTQIKSIKLKGGFLTISNLKIFLMKLK